MARLKRQLNRLARARNGSVRLLLMGYLQLTRQLKRMTPTSLFGRALIIIVAPVLVSQSILSYIFIERHWETVTRRLCDMLASDINLVLTDIDPAVGANNTQILALARSKLELTVKVQPGGTLPRRIGGGFPILERVLTDQLSSSIKRPLVVDTVRAPGKIAVYIQLSHGLVTVDVPLKRITTSTTELLFFWMVGLSIVLLAVAILFLRSLVRPILRLTSAAEAFGKGQSVDDFKPTGAVEVRRAAVAFIAMRQRIERHIRQRTEMLSGISHDLRTPLTRLKLRTALLTASEEREEMNRDLIEMERMLEEFLSFARGQEGEQASLFDLDELLQEVAEEAEVANPEVPVDCQSAVMLMVSLRRQAVKRCLVNLVRNGQRYGTVVQIGLSQRPRAVEIIVDDDGPGIPPPLREDAFRPFVRLDQSRPPNDAGVGLGLAIARDIARGHGGDLYLDDSALGGLRACIRLPT